MKVFLDTNVLVSALTARGLCADLFRYLLAEHEILTGEVNLIELRGVLVDRFHASSHQVATVEGQLRDQGVVPRPVTARGLTVRDPDDAWVLASAIAGGADLLVTGDHDLVAVANVATVRIVSPRVAWEQLRLGE